MRDMILVLDFDSMNSRAVARKLRSERIYCKIVPVDASMEYVQEQDPSGLVLVGGVGGGVAESVPGFDARLLTLGLPVLALGSAARVLCLAMGGALQGVMLDDTIASVAYTPCALFEGVSPGERWIARAERLLLPEGFTPIAEAGGCTVAYAKGTLFGVQFLLERNDPDGMTMLSNFARTVCGCTQWWSTEAFIERAVEELRRVTKGSGALCMMSGGVDSSVCALLAHKACGAQVRCLYVDTGLMRKDEGEQIDWYYRGQLGLEFDRVDAKARFLARLAGVTDPAEKERAVHDELRTVLLEQAAMQPDAQVLVQGTNYTDVVSAQDDGTQWLMESGRFRAVVEPVRELFKDEVRRVGEAFGLPSAIIGRQPFPNAGLALRMTGEVTAEKLEVLRAADAIFREEIAAAGQEKRVGRFYATLVTVPEMSHGAIIGLRATHSGEMAAPAARLPYDLLERVVSRILEDIPQVHRVFYDMTPSGDNPYAD